MKLGADFWRSAAANAMKNGRKDDVELFTEVADIVAGTAIQPYAHANADAGNITAYLDFEFQTRYYDAGNGRTGVNHIAKNGNRIVSIASCEDVYQVIDGNTSQELYIGNNAKRAVSVARNHLHIDN